MTEWRYGLFILSSCHLVILSIPCPRQNRLPGLICIATLPALRFPLAESRLEATRSNSVAVYPNPRWNHDRAADERCFPKVGAQERLDRTRPTRSTSRAPPSASPAP